MNQVFLSDSVYLHFGTSSASTGAATNADTTPTVVVAEDGIDMGYAPTVSNVATGLYKVQIDATSGNGFEAGRRYSVYAVAAVGGITGRDGIGEFEVLQADIDTAVGNIANIQTRLPAALVSGRMDSSVGEMQADTLTASALATDAVTEIQTGLSTLTASQVWAEALETGFTAKELVRLISAAVAGKLSGAATTTIIIRDAADSKNRITATVDSNGNRTAVTYDVS